NILGLGRGFGRDTMFVLFFLALEYARGLTVASVDGVFMGITMLMVLVLPYLLPSSYDRPAFGMWLALRGTVAAAGMLLGVLFRQSMGSGSTGSMRFMPMTFLIL